MTTNQPTRTQPAHTPGPWRLDPDDVMNPDRAFGIIAHDNAEGPDGDATQCVAEVCDGPTSLADARLIAAAPDLLAVVKQLRALRDRWRNDDTFGSVEYLDALDALPWDAAIARAEGGEG